MTKKRTEKNSKKYKSQVKNDIQKRSAEKANKDKRVYNSGAGGSKVVKRVRSDVYTAPSIYGGRIKSSGKSRSYNQYYPYQEGVIDKQMALTNYYNTALKQHSSRNQWQNLITGLSAGQFEDLDQNRREILAKQAVEEEKRKRLDEINIIKRKHAEKLHGNQALMEELKIKTDSTDADIAKRLNIERTALERENEKERNIKAIADMSEKTAKVKAQIRGQIDYMKEQYPGEPSVMALTDNIDEINLEGIQRIKDDAKNKHDSLIPVIKEFKELYDTVRELRANHDIINKMDEEFVAWGQEDPYLAGTLAKKKCKYGSTEERFDEIKKAVEQKQAVFKRLFNETLPSIRESLRNFEKSSEIYRECINEYRKKASKLLLETDMISPEDREKVIHGVFTDIELAQRMDAISPMFSNSEEVKARMDFYSGKLKRLSDPGLMSQYKLHDRYLKPMELMSDLYERTVARMEQGEEINDEELDNEILDIGKVLLRNPHLNENVSYGPMIKPSPMTFAEIPETEQEPIALEVSNPSGVSTYPTDLEISPRSSYEEAFIGGGWHAEKANPEGSTLGIYRPGMTEEEREKHLDEINRRRPADRKPFKNLREFDAMVRRYRDQGVLQTEPEKPKRKTFDVF